MNKLKEVKKYLKDNSNLYVGWSYAEDPAWYPIYETKAECIKARSEFFKEDPDPVFRIYKKKQLEKWYPVNAWVFAKKSGLEENVPVCTVDEFKFN